MHGARQRGGRSPRSSRHLLHAVAALRLRQPPAEVRRARERELPGRGRGARRARVFVVVPDVGPVDLHVQLPHYGLALILVLDPELDVLRRAIPVVARGLHEFPAISGALVHNLPLLVPLAIVEGTRRRVVTVEAATIQHQRLRMLLEGDVYRGRVAILARLAGEDPFASVALRGGSALDVDLAVRVCGARGALQTQLAVALRHLVEHLAHAPEEVDGEHPRDAPLVRAQDLVRPLVVLACVDDVTSGKCRAVLEDALLSLDRSIDGGPQSYHPLLACDFGDVGAPHAVETRVHDVPLPAAGALVHDFAVGIRAARGARLLTTALAARDDDLGQLPAPEVGLQFILGALDVVKRPGELLPLHRQAVAGVAAQRER
mmetsp:Transcript_52398/g.147016  ORF Transcript_52398/g.147016 Transcript_52398/m.147016 type:complete len:375 (+) Transcript_52398:71-1195(+)